MKVFLTRHAVYCFCILMIAGQAYCGIPAEEGAITGVTLTRDLNHVVIQHNGRIGNYSTCVLGNPFRLVLDVGSTHLAQIPAKIKVDRSPISEIRLGYANSRSRVVVDFGDNPVPPFTIERGARDITLKMGKRLALGADRGGKPEKHQEKESPWAKAAASTVAPKKPGSAIRVKATHVDDNRVVVDVADTRDPSKTYLLAVELDRQDLSVQGATLSDARGIVKRFVLAKVEDGISGVKVETVARSARADTAEDKGTDSRAGQTKFKWGVQSAKHAEPLSGPRRNGAFRVEGFVLKPRVDAIARTPDRSGAHGE